MCKSSPIASQSESQPPTLSARLKGSEYTEVGGRIEERVYKPDMPPAHH
jgi:hypothetical protein